MIQRLSATLLEITATGPRQVDSAIDPRWRADCADAIRLELDCPQEILSDEQAAALRRLGDLLESPESGADAVLAAVQTTVRLFELGSMPG